ATEIDCDNVDEVKEQNIHTCCTHPDSHSEVIRNCANQTHFQPGTHIEEEVLDITADRLMTANCFSHCIFDRLKLMKEGKIDMQAVRDYFNTKFASDPEYAKEMINAFDMCKDVGDRDFTLIVKAWHPNCQPANGMILACVVRKFFHNCPATRWSSTQECQRALEYREACPDSFATF
ncbi:hypothetical protein KR222_004784, partial [Zaprionus bogoriensis]